MSKKFLYILMTFALCLGVSAAGAACVGVEQESSDSQPVEQEKPEVKYEGDMLYNGFDSVADIYRVDQLYTWGFQPADGKLEIVGKDNFLPKEEDVEEDTDDQNYQAVIEQIDALPEISAVTFAHKDAVAKARRAYGSLSNENREKVTNIDKLEALENSDALKGYYTVGDFGGGLFGGVTSAAKWSGHSGNLVNAMSGTVIFSANNIAVVDGAFYVSLFHDGSINAGQSGDGIYLMFRTDSKKIGFSNSTGSEILFNEGKSISPDETYTFEIGYDVAEDYSKLTVSVLVCDSQGEEIVNGSQEITTFNLSDFGEQTVKSWLTEHENAETHKTFYINAGSSEGVNVFNAWTPTLATDYDSNLNQDPHDQADLAPRQGEGALRVYYERGAITDILARFDTSLLQGLPVNEIGGFSVKVYNDSAEEKQVTLSLMQEGNVNLFVNGGEFVLAPYAWTECKVTLIPVVVEQFKDQLIGFSVRFKDVTESVYYLDDFRVQFGPVYTEEVNEWIAKAADLDTQIEPLRGKTITVEDKELLETLCLKYDELPQAYRYTVKNASVLTNAVDDYMDAVSAKQLEEEGKETVVYFDSPISAMQIEEISGGYATYTTENAAPGSTGSMCFTFDGSLNWTRVGLNPSKSTGYEEIHVWVNNQSEYKRAFQLDWKVADQVFDAEGNELEADRNGVLPANSGWVKLIYRSKFPLTQINATSLSMGNAAINSVDTLLVSNIEFVYRFDSVESLIEALPAYYEGYSESDIAAVVAARDAYNQLSIESQHKVSNVSKLIGLEANIWKSGFKAISVATPEELTVYSEQDKAAIDALRVSYDKLAVEVRNILKEEEALLCAFEAKIEQTQIAYVESVKAQISALDGTDKEAIEAARAAYDSLTDANKANVDNASVLFGYEAAIWTATLSELPAEKDIVSYDANLTNKFNAIRAEYNALPDEVKALVVSEEATLSALEARHARFGEVVLRPGQIKVTAESWYVVNITPSKDSGYDEARVLLRNDSANKLVFQATWNIAAKAYDEAGNEVSLVGGYVLPANSGWLTLVFTASFKWSELDLVLFDELNNAIAGEIDLTVDSITFLYKAPAVEAMIDALDGTDKAAIIAARAAYNALSANSKANVANLDKLIGYEADVWAEGMNELPSSADEITAYDGAVYAKVNAMLDSYAQLDEAVQAKLTEEKALLDSLKTKFTSFQSEIVAAWKAKIDELPTEEEIVQYDADLADKLYTIRAEYDMFADDAKGLLVDEEATLSALEAKLAQFGEIVLKPGNIKQSGDDWYTIAISPSKTTGYQEARVKLRNNGSTAIVFQVNWNVAAQAYDANGTEIAVDPNGVIAANSDWITLVFTKTDIAWTEFNIAHYENGAVVGDIDVTVESITFIYEKAAVNPPAENDSSEVVLQPGDIKQSGGDWYTIAISPSKTTGYLEAHVKVRNNGSTAIVFQVNWKVAVKALDADGNEIAVDPNGVIAANSGWITLVFTQTDIAWTEFNIAHYENGAVVGDIDVTVESVTFVYKKEPVKAHDFTSDISKVSSVTVDGAATTNVTAAYSESEQALELGFPGLAAGTWVNLAMTAGTVPEFTTAHLFVKNDTDVDIVVQMNWNLYTSVESGDASKITTLWDATCIKANSGWVELVYTVGAGDINNLNIALANQVTSGALYISKITLE